MSAQILLTDAEVERFWTKIQKGDAATCWLWASELNNQGYGRFSIWRHNKRHRFLAHRLAYKLAKGELGNETKLLHECDTPPCCNYNHLRPGTQADNMADAKAKGRAVPPPLHFGAENPHARLNEHQVMEILRRHAEGAVSQRALAEEFDVSPSLVSRIVLRKSWRHVTQGAAA